MKNIFKIITIIVAMTPLSTLANNIHFTGMVVDSSETARKVCVERAISEGISSVCSHTTGSVIHAVVKDKKVPYNNTSVTARFVTLNFF